MNASDRQPRKQTPMTYAKCADAYADGRADIPRTDPAYAKKLDRDGDGVACELKDAPAGFTRKPQDTKTSKPKPAKTQAVVGVETGTGTGDRLPKTGPAAEAGVVGSGVLLLGVLAVVAFRRRRTRFTV